MGKTAYIHIGMMKTGTTSVQYFFDVNRSAFREQGFYYSKVAGDRSHTGLVCYALSNDKINDVRIRNGISCEKDVRPWKEMFKGSLLEEFGAACYDGALFSCENLASLLVTESEVLSLKQLIGEMFDDVKIVMYVRRQDKAIQSFYSTELKNGHFHTLGRKEIKSYLNRFDYFSIYSRWSKVFGSNNVILRVFDERNLVKSDIIDDLEYLIESIDSSGLKRPSRENESLGWVGAEILKSLNPIVGMPTENGKINPSRGKLGDLISKFDDSIKMTVGCMNSNDIYSMFYQSNTSLELAAGWEKGSIFPLVESSQNSASYEDDIDYKTLFFESMGVIGEVWSVSQNLLVDAQTKVHLNAAVAYLNESVVHADKKKEKMGIMELLKAIRVGDKYGKAKALLERWGKNRR